MLALLRPAAVLLVLFTVLTGPRLSGSRSPELAQALFPVQANGSLIRQGGQRRSARALIGQPFDDPGYFWSRPSATAPYAIQRGSSTGSNLGPLNPGPARRGGKARVARASRRPNPVNHRARSGRPRDRLGQRPRPRHLARGGLLPGASRRARPRLARRSKFAGSCSKGSKVARFGILGEPRSTCCGSTWLLTNWPERRLTSVATSPPR